MDLDGPGGFGLRRTIVGAIAVLVTFIVCARGADAAIPTAEREALIALYNSTSGANWVKNTNWLGAPGTECTWYGVVCDAGQSTVTELQLEENWLKGTIPPALSALTNLEVLKLSWNRLDGSIPPELGNLAKLKVLDLVANYFLGGDIPPELGKLSNLQRLRLDGNGLTGRVPEELGDLSNLESLGLSSNRLSGSIPAHLGNLTKLQTLELSYNLLTGTIPAELGRLSNLRILKLDSNELSGSIPRELGDLANLRLLWLYFNELSGSIPSELGRLSRLWDLSLFENQLDGSIPAELGEIPELQVLDLWRNHLSGSIPPELGKLSNLRYLQLNSNDLSGSIPPELGKLSRLWSMNLRSNHLSGSIPAELGNAAGLAAIDLGRNQLSGAMPTSIGNLANLQSLNLFGNRLSGAIPSSLGHLSQLFKLDLSLNQLSGGIPADLGNMKSLQYLYLASNQLTGSIPATLASLTRVAPGYLELRYNALSATDAAADVWATDREENWKGTQTVAPSSIELTSISTTNATLTWTPIRYTSNAGRYEVWADGGSGPVLAGSTETKSAAGLTVVGLTSGNRYAFTVRTVTEPVEYYTRNRVMSEFSPAVLATTSGTPPLPDPIIVVSGCARVAQPCSVTARSAAGWEAGGWSSAWSLDGVATASGRTWSPSIAQPGTHVIELTTTNATGSATAATTLQLEAAVPCTAGALCALDGRFEITLVASDPRTGNTGAGVPVQQNDLFGYFSIPALTSDPENPEVFVKMLDGRSVNGSYWSFYGGLTDLAYTITVKDTVAATSATYEKPGGTSQGGFDVGGGVTPESCPNEVGGAVQPASTPAPCGTGTDRLCLDDARFRVKLIARDARTGATGPGLAIAKNDLFGYFAIPALTSNEDNPEVFVKILDGRPVNGKWWLFFSGLTDLEYTLSVTDTTTGATKSYAKAAGSACGAFDVSAF